MSAESATSTPRSLTDDHKDALIAEMLGEVTTLHQSVRDLVAITDDADRRITGRVTELRALVADLGGLRETLLAELAVRSGDEAKRALRESLGGLDERITTVLRELELQTRLDGKRQWTDRAAVAIVTAAISSIATLAGVAILLRLH